MTSQKSLLRLKDKDTKDKSLLGQTSRIFARKRSFGFGSSQGITRPAETRASQQGLEYKRPPLVFLPTYQIDSYFPFNVEHVTAAAEQVVNELFVGHKYNVNDTPALALRMAGEAMRRTKILNFNRYRIIAVCTLGQKRAQSYNNAISFVWDGERDKYVDVHRETHTCLCQLTIFGVYLD